MGRSTGRVVRPQLPFIEASPSMLLPPTQASVGCSRFRGCSFIEACTTCGSPRRNGYTHCGVPQPLPVAVLHSGLEDNRRIRAIKFSVRSRFRQLPFIEA